MLGRARDILNRNADHVEDAVPFGLLSLRRGRRSYYDDVERDEAFDFDDDDQDEDD